MKLKQCNYGICLLLVVVNCDNLFLIHFIFRGFFFPLNGNLNVHELNILKSFIRAIGLFSSLYYRRMIIFRAISKSPSEMIMPTIQNKHFSTMRK